MEIVDWKTPPLESKILDNEVHLWIANLDLSVPQIEQLTNTLSIKEIERADRFKFSEHRDRFIAARGYLRKLLSDYLNLPSKGIVFNYSDRGKPKLENNSLQFNVSHSQNIALYCFTKDRQIGIDLEYLRADVDADKIAQRFFSQQEFQLIANLNIEEQNKTFFRLWTIKEAYLKATGEGLMGGLDTVDVKVNSDGKFSVRAIAKKKAIVNDWFFASFIPDPNFVAAIAIKNKQQTLNLKQFMLN